MRNLEGPSARAVEPVPSRNAFKSRITWKLAAAFAALVVMLVVLAACNPHSDSDQTLREASTYEQVVEFGGTETPTSGVSLREMEYLTSVQTFPLEMPAGFVFPEQVPPLDWPGITPEIDNFGNPAMSGEMTAYHWWACSKFAASWEALEAGDIATADAHYAEILRFQQGNDPGLAGWSLTPRLSLNEQPRAAGESGLCLQWLDALDAA